MHRGQNEAQYPPNIMSFILAYALVVASDCFSLYFRALFEGFDFLKTQYEEDSSLVNTEKPREFSLQKLQLIFLLKKSAGVQPQA